MITRYEMYLQDILTQREAPKKSPNYQKLSDVFVGITGFEPVRNIAAPLESAMSANSIRSPEVCRMNDHTSRLQKIRTEWRIPAARVLAGREWAWACQ